MMSVSMWIYTALLLLYWWILLKMDERKLTESDQRAEGEERFLGWAIYLNAVWILSMFLPYLTPSWPDAYPWVFVGVGVVVFVVGTWVRWLAIRTLGKFFTYELCIRQEHQIVQHGIYSVLRHPSYTGTLLEVTGMMLVARSWIGALVFWGAAGTIIGVRIFREERMLRQQFGEEYRAYEEQTWRLLPWVF